jgi:hypothetical protein
MPRILDLTGQRFGRLTALSRIKTPGKPSKWLCQCDCGNTSTPHTKSLTTGDTQSCGCIYKGPEPIHNMYKTAEYRAWGSLVQRCTNPNSRNWRNYGGRGITVCERWRNSFADFYKDMGPRPTPVHQIDRIDNDGNYEPGNCRWATRSENQDNRRNTIMLALNGELKSITEWCKELNISKSTVQYRLKSGWEVERTLTTPPEDKYHSRSYADIARARESSNELLT